MPEYFWCAFIGIPLLGIGIQMCKIGYLKPIADYLIEETGGANSIANCIIKGASATESFCIDFGHATNQGANFCSICGTKED